MQQAKCWISVTAPYCQSKYHATPKLNKELPDAYEQRTWRERLHYDPETEEIYISEFVFANCLKECAKFLSVQIPGKGKATYTKHFEAGIAVQDPIYTGWKKSEALAKEMFVPSNGIRGGGSRVMKIYPIIPPTLNVIVDFLISDDIISSEVFAQHLVQAGNLIGIGAFRLRNNGIFGKFHVDKIEWGSYKSSSKLPPIIYVDNNTSEAA